MSIVEKVFQSVKRRDPDQPEFHQAVWEVLESRSRCWKHTQNMLMQVLYQGLSSRKNDSISSSLGR